ncbi:glycosyltransferase [Serpentinicella sp. ANB-PHB4]|uniref:glycosyltransferase n=1 Tax=Serpentinicella sp. ANB-PHB4 TaxID=3074076 RepID=UPI002855B709|nr:glycosyltransferase [Serpentinicella sp. ANB-PHB4]MDR5658761.1 glycosyltransferase [Serpentinicella sp. ANB-PHB4]
MKKVIMIVTNRYDPDVRVHKEAKYLVSRGFEVEILCWDRENDYINDANEEIEDIKITRFFPYSKYGTGYKQLKSFCKFILEVKEYLKDIDYDFMHCHDLDGMVVGTYIKKNNSKLVFDMHEIYELQGNKKKTKYLIRLIVNYYQKKADHILYVNKIQKETSNQTTKMIYLPNYSEKKLLGNIDKNLSEKINISYIGSVRQYEEFRNLFEACKNMEKVRISIHGAGIAFKDLNELQKKYNNVTTTGVYDIKKLPLYYSEADIIYAVYPKKNIQHMNSYPVKFYEAIITATPIIVSKGSILEKFVIDEDIGFVVDGDKINNIKNVIEYLVNNPEIIYQKKNRIEKLKHKFTWEEIVGNLDYIYSS